MGTAATGHGQVSQSQIARHCIHCDVWSLTALFHSATPIHRSGMSKSKVANVPDHPPPPGYICYRCGEKGHWIQVCPTNDDPAYENRPRVKRTTGIPRSFLKTVEKPMSVANDGTMDDTKQPAGVMVNAEGEWVIAEPDKASWDEYQAKAKVSAAAQEAAKQGGEDIQNKGLECSIDKRLFLDPTKTPCCEMTFCHDCITNALLENDLRCPHCSTEDILIDDLKPDRPMIAKIREYEEQKRLALADSEKSKSPVRASPSGVANSQWLDPSNKHSSHEDQRSSNLRKRPAESELVNDRISHNPSQTVMKGSASDSGPDVKQDSLTSTVTPQTKPTTSSNTSMPSIPSTTNYPVMNNFMPLAMTMPPAMGLNPVFQSPMMMPNGSYPSNEWNSMYGMNFTHQTTPMHSGGFPNTTMPSGIYNQPPNMMNMNTMAGMNGAGGPRGYSTHDQGKGPFANQQRTTFSGVASGDEDSAYFRKPVNPHRHQARRNVPRPTDYREI